MQQIQQALALDEHGDREGAMNVALRLLEQHPNYEPAIKLKGLLLEEAGRTSEAAAETLVMVAGGKHGLEQKDERPNQSAIQAIIVSFFVYLLQPS